MNMVPMFRAYFLLRNSAVLKHFSRVSCKVGDKKSVSRRISSTDVERFIELSGDTNPIHSAIGQQRAVVHGAFLNSLVSAVIGTELPGFGTLVVQQTLNFPNKCFVGEEVKVTVEVVSVRKIMTVKFECVVEAEKKIVLYGDAKLVASKAE